MDRSELLEIVEHAANYGWKHAGWDWPAVKADLARFIPPPPAEQAKGEFDLLVKYGQHLEECRGSASRDCTCGLDAAIASALSQRPVVTCGWVSDENGPWLSACGQAWEFTEGGPEDNNYRFCHGCGKPILAITTGDCT